MSTNDRKRWAASTKAWRLLKFSRGTVGQAYNKYVVSEVSKV